MCLPWQDDRGQVPACKGQREAKSREKESEKKTDLIEGSSREEEEKKKQRRPRKSHPERQDREKMSKTRKKENKNWTETSRNRTEGRVPRSMGGGGGHPKW